MVKRLTAIVFALCLLAPAGATFTASADEPAAAADYWPLWRSYAQFFISADGRVIDRTGGERTTSEGQAYGMFHALVAGDREVFERLLKWTEANLAGADLKANLPAWNWGKNERGEWGVLDKNAASDADLWMAYALLEAGRLWGENKFTVYGRAMARNIVEKEIETLPGLGPMLLPGPFGFHVDENTWRLNPSYLPLQIVRAMQFHRIAGPWEALGQATVKMIRQTSPHGFAPDWVAYHAKQGFIADPVHGAVGAYDAIRTYLWSGMLADEDPAKAAIASRVNGLYRYWQSHDVAVEKIETQTGKALSTTAPVGFLAALAPEVYAMGKPEEIQLLGNQIGQFRSGDLYGNPPTYYDQNLLLFAMGFVEKRFHFTTDGLLKTNWK